MPHDPGSGWRARLARGWSHRHATSWKSRQGRRGFPGLALLVQERLKADPHAGHLFVFRGKRGDLIKVIWHDGQGACLFSKRLEKGRFIWPVPTTKTDAFDASVTISPAQLGYMLEGIDWRAPQKTYRPQIAG